MFHCTAGKDRTGVFAAIVLGALGVDDQAVLEDYKLTNQTMDLLFERLRAIPGNEQRPRESFEAQPKALEEVLASLRNGYGAAEGYLKAHGVEEPTIDQLKTHLLE